jgi:hypothetical protein
MWGWELLSHNPTKFRKGDILNKIEECVYYIGFISKY